MGSGSVYALTGQLHVSPGELGFDWLPLGGVVQSTGTEGGAPVETVSVVAGAVT